MILFFWEEVKNREKRREKVVYDFSGNDGRRRELGVGVFDWKRGWGL